MVAVSVIMPVFNSGCFLYESIGSVLKQTFVDFELICIDDCSDQLTKDILIELQSSDCRVKVIFLDENSGPAVARNVGIESSVGRYIAFLDSDDVWSVDKLKCQIDFMSFNKVAFSYSAFEKIDEFGNVFGSVGVPDRVCYGDLLKVCSVGCLTAIYDVQQLGKVYMPPIRKRQDLGLWLRILKRIPYAYATPGILAQYRVRTDSISANKRVAAQYTWKLYREIEGPDIWVF